jgi:membrane protease YdiL (CAAX protease family)
MQMPPTTRQPQARFRALPDPAILALLAFASLLTWGQVQMRRSSDAAAADTAGADARLFEMRWALGPPMAPGPSKKPRANRWDNAVEAVVRIECGRADEARDSMAHAPDGAFRACWEAAYGPGPMPTPAETREAMRGLGGGLAAGLLDAALAKKASGGHGTTREGTREDAIMRHRRRAYALSTVFALAVAGAAAGIAVGARMIAGRAGFLGLAGAPGTPAFRMANAAAVRVFLAWYIAFLSSATVAGWIGAAVPLGPFAMPLAYILHSAFGIGLVCRAEGISMAALWGRITSDGSPWLTDGLKYLLLVLACALLLGLDMSPFLPEGGRPQKDLTEFIRSASGAVPLAAAFGTVAILGPAFEEVFFRGFLLPVMRRRTSPAAAILLSGGIFGAVHLQPAAFPLLAVLGSLLGMAFLATRDVRAAILVHACWNGGAFLFQRLLLG